jgi:anti-sigma-K factor RskA
MRYDHPEIQDHLAAQAMLGTLTPRVRRRLQRLAATRPALRERLAEWSRWGHALADGVAPREASPALWANIEQRTGLRAADPLPAGGRRGFDVWRWLLGGSLGGVLAGVLATTLLVRAFPQWVTDTETMAQAEHMVPQSYIGILAAPDGRALAWIGSTRHGQRLFVKLAEAVPLQAGETLHLRGLAKDRPAQDLGVLAPAKGRSEIALAQPAEALFKPVTELEIVAQAADGSTRLVARGPCAKIW